MATINFNNLDELQSYIDGNIRENHVQAITGTKDNNSQSGLVKAIKKAILNYNGNPIVSEGGVVVVNTPFTTITQVTPSSLSWDDSTEIKQYYIMNATAGVINLADGFSYLDVSGAVKTVIPGNTTVHLVRMTNSMWANYYNAGGSVTPGNPITITQQPSSASIVVGESFTLTVAATGGTGTLTYQLYKNDAAVSGATSNTYTKANAQVGDAGSYYFKVSDGLGSIVNSSSVNVAVAAAALQNVYYGAKSLNVPGLPSDSEIAAALHHMQDTNLDVLVNFTSFYPAPHRLFALVQKSGANSQKNFIQDTVVAFNGESMLSSGDTFGPVQTVSYNGSDYWAYVSNFNTARANIDALKKI